MAPFFQGQVFPTPPQQNAPWPHGDDPLAKAAATLFEQGLADPRGLEYREIEIAVGNPWDGGGYPVKTHGWILPENGQVAQFAVAWNGLIYPIVRVGAAADLDQDCAPDSPMAQPITSDFGAAAETVAVSFASPSRLKLVLLLRLGETAAVNQISKLDPRPDRNPDPYLDLASDWAWNLFERAVCAHERGDDYLSAADSRKLTAIQPLIEAEARRRGFVPLPDHTDSRFSDRQLPYLLFLQQLPALLANSERRVNERKNEFLPKNELAALIDDLENVDARQWAQPGAIALAEDQHIQAVVKLGNKAVEPLLEAMENDRRLTRSVSFGRDFWRDRQLISVSEAAYAALVDLLRFDFRASGKNGQPLTTRELAAVIRSYWTKMGSLSPAERFYATLKDDQAGKDLWLQAAANLVQPVDVEFHGGWTTIPNRQSGQQITLRGESVHDKRTPSVSQLLAQRSDEIAAIRTGSSADLFLYLDAGEMALDLAAWDKRAAIPTLTKRLQRVWSIGAQPDDILASNGNPVERFGTMIAKMTLARARCGDEAAYDEYARWIQRVELKNVYFGNQELLKPLIEGMGRPSIGQAIDYLFNDPKSPWSNLLSGGSNAFWLVDFWQTPLPQTIWFRRQAERGLNDQSFAGTITFNPRQDWNSRMEAEIELKGLSAGYSGSNHDPDTPPPGQKRSFRICDAFAYFYSRFQNGPKFELFWPEKKRDEGVSRCHQWLATKK